MFPVTAANNLYLKLMKIYALKIRNINLPDFEIFQLVCIDFVNEEVWHLLAKLVEAEQEALHIAELQLGFLVGGILSILPLLWGQRHIFLQEERSPSSMPLHLLKPKHD